MHPRVRRIQNPLNQPRLGLFGRLRQICQLLLRLLEMLLGAFRDPSFLRFGQKEKRAAGRVLSCSALGSGFLASFDTFNSTVAHTKMELLGAHTTQSWWVKDVLASSNPALAPARS